MLLIEVSMPLPFEDDRWSHAHKPIRANSRHDGDVPVEGRPAHQHNLVRRFGWDGDLLGWVFETSKGQSKRHVSRKKQKRLKAA